MAEAPAVEDKGSLKRGQEARQSAVTFVERTDITALLGARVRIDGLKKMAALNGEHGVVLRYEEVSSRYLVRREISTHAAAAVVVKLRPTNLRAVARHGTLTALQQLLDAAPAGSRVTLPRGAVDRDGERTTLVLPSALTLIGMGCRTGGTVLNFGIKVDEDVTGEAIIVSGVHINGAVAIAPRDVARVRLSKVSITAPATEDAPALLLEEISCKVPRGEVAGRVVLEDCWVRGGGVGVAVYAVGTLLRRCRVQGTRSFGVNALARLAIEGCTIGQCADGGILARAGCDQVRTCGGINENRVQRDANDPGYAGFSPDCRGCVGRCTCTAMYGYALAALMGESGSAISWGRPGQGRWQNVGCADG